MKLCGFEVGLDQPIFLIAGTCVIESRQMAFDVAGAVAPALSHSVLALALGQAFFVLLSLACWDTARRHRRKLRARGELTP